MARASETPRRRPPQRSLYRKLHIVLTEADRDEARSIGALIENIQMRGYPDFTRYATLEDGTATVVPCSPEATSRAVELAVALGLVDSSTGRATKRGSQGVELDKFDRVLAQGAEAVLARMGTPHGDIQQACARLLEAHARNQLPTWENIADELGLTEA